MLKNLVWTAVGLAVVGFARIAFSALALRAFGEHAAGQLGVALSVAVLLSLPTTAAFGAATVRFVGRAHGQQDRAGESWLLTRMGLLTLVAATCSTVVALLMTPTIEDSWSVEQNLTIQAAFVSFAYVGYLVLKNTYYALDRVGSYVVAEVTAGIFFVVALVGLLWAAAQSLFLLSIGVLYATFSLVALTFVTRHVRSLPAARRPGDFRWRDLGSYAGLSAVGTTCSMAVREIGVVISADMVGFAGAAWLALSISLMTPLMVLPRILRPVVIAHSAQQEGRGQLAGLARSVSTMSHWLLVSTVTTATLLFILAPTLLQLLGGDVPDEAIFAFRVLLAGATVEVIATPSINALAGLGRMALLSASSVLGLVVAVVVWGTIDGSQAWQVLVWGLTLSAVARSLPALVSSHLHHQIVLTRQLGRVLLLLSVCAVACWGAIAVRGALAHYVVAGAFVVVALVVLSRELGEIKTLVAGRLARTQMRQRRPSA